MRNTIENIELHFLLFLTGKQSYIIIYVSLPCSLHLRNFSLKCRWHLFSHFVINRDDYDLFKELIEITVV